MDGQTFKEKSLNKFNREAATYENTMDGKFCSRAYSDIIDTINKLEIHSLLDVGCGTGIILGKIHESNPSLDLYGHDLSPQMILETQKRLGKSIECSIGDAESLPYEDSSLDAILCSFSFHHYPHPDIVLSQMNRVLKPNGKLILAEGWMPVPFRQIFNALIGYSNSGDVHVYSKKEITKLLTTHHFNLDNFKHPTHDTFLVIASKKTN